MIDKTDKMLNLVQMENCDLVACAIERGTSLHFMQSNNFLNKITPHQLLIGSLLYLFCTTIPDFSFAVSYDSRFTHRPTKSTGSIAKMVLRYLKGTKSLKITYNSRDKNCIRGSSSAKLERRKEFLEEYKWLHFYFLRCISSPDR